MISYILRRLILIAVVLIGLSILTFTITRLIPADPVRLAQVFSNLLNNAAKYTRPGGSIAVVLQV
jgi:signal transduction histidine kinase